MGVGGGGKQHCPWWYHLLDIPLAAYLLLMSWYSTGTSKNLLMLELEQRERKRKKNLLPKTQHCHCALISNCKSICATPTQLCHLIIFKGNHYHKHCSGRKQSYFPHHRADWTTEGLDNLPKDSWDNSRLPSQGMVLYHLLTGSAELCSFLFSPMLSEYSPIYSKF